MHSGGNTTALGARVAYAERFLSTDWCVRHCTVPLLTATSHKEVVFVVTFIKLFDDTYSDTCVKPFHEAIVKTTNCS